MQGNKSAKPLHGQCAFITGGGAGIGRAIALSFAEAGANIAIADVQPERCQEVADRVRELGAEALPLPTDATNTDQLEEAIAATHLHFGRLDILVNNAGGTGKKPFTQTSVESWRKLIDLNLVSMLTATHAAAALMIAGGRGGAIINVSSIEASRAAPNFSVYAACKAGMNNFTRTMAVELGDHNIRVNAIAPDFTETPGLRGNIKGPVDPDTFLPFPPAARDAINRRMPLGRAGKPEECGAAALFLASPAASYITGIILPVDGGAWASSGWMRDQGGAWVLAEKTLPNESNSS